MNCGRYLFSASGCWLMKRCSLPEAVDVPLLLVVEEQPGQRLILAVVHFQAYHFVGGDDGREADERGEAAAEVGVALKQLLVGRPVRGSDDGALAVPDDTGAWRRRSAPGTARRDHLVRESSLPSTTNSRSRNRAAGSRTSVTVFAATTRLASSTGLPAGCLPNRSFARP